MNEPIDFERSERLYDQLESVQRRWPLLPNHVRLTIVELISHYGPPPVTVHFPTPSGVKWSDLEIVLNDPWEATMSIGGVTESYTFAALGLADKRSPKRPRAEWRMLRTYAENPEPDAYYKLPERENLKVDISKFRLWLKGFFRLPGDPLRSFESARWMPRFKIRANY